MLLFVKTNCIRGIKISLHIYWFLDCIHWFHILYAVRTYAAYIICQCKMPFSEIYEMYTCKDSQSSVQRKPEFLLLQTVNLSHHCHPMWYKMFLKSHIIYEINVVCLYRENNSINCGLLTDAHGRMRCKYYFRIAMYPC